MRTIFSWIIGFGIVEIIIIALVLVNVLAFLLYAADKRKALKNKWRIRENTLILLTLAFGGIGGFLGMRLVKHKTKHTKFKIAVAIGLIITLIPVIHITHALTLDRIIHFAEISFYSDNWPPELDGYRIAFMTDFHTKTSQEMRSVQMELNERNLDLILLGGDFSMGSEYLQDILTSIAEIPVSDGIFGVEGNHDDHRRLFTYMEQRGIIPLDNNGRFIRDGFFLAGVQDMWNRTPDIKTAIAGASADDFILLVSHNPDVSMVQPTAGIDLILAGHTHNGQITFFGLPLYLLRGSITNYGMHFSRGFAYSADGVPVFTSSGIGTYYNVPRILARPEVVIFTMYSGVN